LLLHGELPNKAQLADLGREVTMHTYVHENIKQFIDGFRYDAHPMSMLASTVAALASFYPEAKDVQTASFAACSDVRFIAKMPTLAAWSRTGTARACRSCTRTTI
jgi:citrate synthase